MNPEKLSLQSADGAQINLDMLYQIAPACFSEARGADGKVRRVVNFDVLRQLLGDAAADTGEEFYQFTWPGKAEARREAARSIRKTLRPVPEDSVDWDTTQNLYIEGDNLEVLKLLQKSYMGKVKMIYIDPPYNTGNDFVYKDDLTTTTSAHDRAEGNTDELGNRYRKNTDSNGRFHSDWCSMIYARLQLARNLLSEDGVIFISIDDNEVDNLTKICNEIFGETNFISHISNVNNIAGRSDSYHIAKAHEYILVYQKSSNFKSGGLPLSESAMAEYKYSDERGQYRLQGLRKRGSNSKREDRPNLFYPLYYNKFRNSISLEKEGQFDIEITPKLSDGSDGNWRWGKSTFLEKVNLLEVRLVHGRNEYDVFEKVYINSDQGQKTMKMKSFLLDPKYTSDNATTIFRSIMPAKIFDSPKSPYLIIDLLRIGSLKNSIILDFFSGSATTAHAVTQLNAEDGGNRKFILVQLPEVTEEGSEARKAGYENICEIGKERIRRAGRKIKEEAGILGQDLDIGFRVFRVDESNMEDVYFQPAALSQDKLDLYLDNVKSDRTDLDLLFGAMLDWGVKLSLPMSKVTIDGCDVYTVNEGDLVACFAQNITENVIAHIADQSPLRVLLRDSCFNSDADKINIFEQFKQRLGWTDEEAMKNIRVI